MYRSNLCCLACEAQYALAWKQQARTKFSHTHGQSKKSIEKGCFARLHLYTFYMDTALWTNHSTRRFVQQRWG